MLRLGVVVGVGSGGWGRDISGVWLVYGYGVGVWVVYAVWGRVSDRLRDKGGSRVIDRCKCMVGIGAVLG